MKDFSLFYGPLRTWLPVVAVATLAMVVFVTQSGSSDAPCDPAAVECSEPLVGERQLLDLGLVDTVTGVLAETGLPAGQLELEVTEELILDRLERSLLVLRQLDLLGVRLAIDDFGTSQASLGRLKELAMVSTLKIDRLFVDGIATDPVDRKIVAAIVALASTVGMEVVAEGVETAAQARVLADLGVEHLQGFLFTRPGSADAVAPIFARPQRHRWQH